MLNHLGKAQLIKLTLQAIPIHNSLVFKMPNEIVNQIKSICMNFLWFEASEQIK